tara:strand:+ start:185 stop:898 length:714 start_codon:yes stop_codon:yes gene_type:complete
MDWVHYTNSVDAISGIIENGLLVNPLERKLIHLFSDSPHFDEREPQQFGLTSLRKDGFFGSRKHIKLFGNLGIVFNNDWVEKEEFQKVWYLKENSERHRKLKAFFGEAEKELIQCINKRPPNDSFPYMGYTNKSVASLLGAGKYCHFLSIYEYLEPAKNRWQKEYRSVQKEPLYNSGTTGGLVNSISKPGWNNMLMTKKFQPQDVSHFVTERKFVRKLKDSLPKEYQNKEVKWKIFT